ncbi:MAG: class I SAM-dependent methyltransferase [Candidatus Krumholzibacteriota bacterium]|nr:class I SAM-dependent methyltransferase [Candidatus Krumholzibacteriota bacterium]
MYTGLSSRLPRSIAVMAFVFSVLCLFSTPRLFAQEKESADIETLREEFATAYESGDYSTALEKAKKMNETLEWDHAEALFNIARTHSRLGNDMETYIWLKRAIDAGYWWARGIMDEKDLERFRAEPWFRELVRYAWSKGYASLLEREDRGESQYPDKVMESLDLKPGLRIADIGAGTGYFTVRFARAVGPDGKVWARDISQEMLDYLEKRLEVEKIDNVELVKVGPEDPLLEKGSMDMIFMIDTIHYVKDRAAYAKKVLDGLAPGGKFVIIDYRPKPMEERPWGPPPEQQIPRETMDEDMEGAGFKVVGSYDYLPEQYFVIYQAK